MRLYNSASCTPVVMRGFSSKTWRTPHHFVPLRDTSLKPSVRSDPVSRRRSSKKFGGSYCDVPDVLKSSTNTTASTSPEREKSAGSKVVSEEDIAEDTISFSDLHQRASYYSFHFDLDTNEHASEQHDGQHCSDEHSSSTVSTKSLYLFGQSIDILSFEDFVDDEFEDAQVCRTDPNASHFIICKPSANREEMKGRDIDDLQYPTRERSRSLPRTGKAAFKQAKHIFPPIDRPKKPPQVPSVVASPIAIGNKQQKGPERKKASPSRMSQRQPNLDEFWTDDTERAPTLAQQDGDIELLNSSPQKEKYLRMLKVGLSMGAVRLEMAKDTVSPANKLPKPTKVGDVQRFRIHWENFHPDPTPSGPCLWNQVSLDEDWLHDIVIDHDRMKMLFEKCQSSRSLSSNSSRRQPIRIIEPKRANNCAIFLASLNLSSREIATAIDQVNHAAFTSDQIHDLQKFLPTEKETEALAASLKANPNLTHLEGENYMVEMMKVEDAATKLDVMATMKRFPFCCHAVTSEAKRMRSICNEIILSTGLRKMIALILHLGNLVNATSGKEAVNAVRLSCLLKLNQTRSFDANTSFLDYVASVAWKNCSSIEFPRGLDAVAKLDWKNRVVEFERLDAKLPQIRQLALKHGPVFLEAEEELYLLNSTSTGRFALEAYRKAAFVYAEIQDTHVAFRRLCDYFGEASADPQNLIKDVAAFCHQVQESLEKTKKNACPNSLPTIAESSSSYGSI